MSSSSVSSSRSPAQRWGSFASATASPEEVVMLTLVGAVLSIALFAYLVVAMLLPEKF